MKKRFFLFLISQLVFITLSSYAFNGKSDKQVVIITIDGLRADIVNETHTPNMYKLLKNGSFSLNTSTVSPSITTPAHLSLVTGLTPKNHSVDTNDVDFGKKNFKSSTIFTAASNNGLKTGLIVGKAKLELIRKGSPDTHYEFIEYREKSTKLIKESSIDYITESNPNLVLIHFPEPDLTGHKYNWISLEYMDKVKEVDKSVYSLVRSIEEKNPFNNYLTIITADHGGMGSNHRIENDKVKKIPLIILGNGIKKNNKLIEEIHIYDISPTVLDFLGLDIPPNLDGNIIRNIYID